MATAAEDDIRIINSHTHVFTLDHVPVRFLPFNLTHALRRVPFQRALVAVLRGLKPFDSRDIFNRYANFLQIGSDKSQAEVFATLSGYYPKGSRFIVLPMDMAFMGAGLPQHDLHRQHADLAALARDPNLAGAVVPFIAVDPRRQTEGGENLVKMVEGLLGEKHDSGEPVFRGVKLYPPLGYLPTDRALDDVWALCAERGLPVMTHCSRGGIKSKRLPADVAAGYADPDHYREILDRHATLRLCLAHFGGDTDWHMYFNNPKSKEEVPLDAPASERRHMNWLTKIRQMIEDGRYQNLYTDISYTVFYVDRYMPALKVFLWNDKLRRRTLFGSDFYMTQAEVFEEQYLSMKLRAELGDETFREIACANPLVFLGEAPPANPSKPQSKRAAGTTAKPTA